MSTVVGLKTKKGTWIGCDSRASTEDGDIRPVVAQKIFNNGPYMIGFIGSIRGGQITYPEYFTPPEKMSDWPDALISQCENKRCLGIGDQQTSIMLCNYVIADKRDGKLYEILVDFQLNEIDEMTVVGSGSAYAYGSLFTTRELNINGDKRVLMALKSAGKFDTATGDPFYIEKVKLVKEK